VTLIVFSYGAVVMDPRLRGDDSVVIPVLCSENDSGSSLRFVWDDKF
jgi:hypothetical protein